MPLVSLRIIFKINYLIRENQKLHETITEKNQEIEEFHPRIRKVENDHNSNLIDLKDIEHLRQKNIVSLSFS